MDFGTISVDFKKPPHALDYHLCLGGGVDGLGGYAPPHFFKKEGGGQRAQVGKNKRLESAWFSLDCDLAQVIHTDGLLARIS